MANRPEVKPTTKDEVIAWLGLQDEKTTSLDLRRNGSPKRVQRFAVAANGELDALAEKILKCAEIDGASRAVPMVNYELGAWGPTSDQDGDGNLTIRIRGAGNGHSDDLDQPDLGAAFVHVLRSHGDLTRLLVSSKDAVQEQLMRQLEYMGKRLDADDAKRIELYRLLEDLSDVKLRREIEAQHSKLLERRQDLLADKIDQYLPIAANRLFGGGPGTGKIPMSEQLVQVFMQSVTPEQIEALTNGEAFAFNEKQQLIFAELFSSAAKKHAQREARKIALDAKAVPDPKAKASAEGEKGATP